MCERIICRKCGSEKVIKKGKAYSVLKGVWVQRYQCLDCKYKFRGKKKHIATPMEKPFKYQSKELPKRNWSSINASQINEKLMLMDLTKELLELIPVNQIQKTGRPANKIQDILFCMILKTYTKLPARRLISDLQIAKKQDYISKVPSYSTLMIYFNDKRLTRLLKELIHLSGLPLKELETHYSIDASGFSTSKFGRWFNYKFGTEKEKRIYRKLHIMIGTKTNIVTSVEITNQYKADSPQLKHLIKKTALHYNIKEVSADKAYLSQNNLELIDELGGIPFIPFKTNSKKGKHRFIWRKMYNHFKQKPQEFFEHYHLRSNVETTFHMIKQKFGSTLMTKNYTANVNEILCKVLTHNLTRLIQAYHEFNIKTNFQTQVPITKELQVSALSF